MISLWVGGAGKKKTVSLTDAMALLPCPSFPFFCLFFLSLSSFPPLFSPQGLALVGLVEGVVDVELADGLGLLGLGLRHLGEKGGRKSQWTRVIASSSSSTHFYFSPSLFLLLARADPL